MSSQQERAYFLRASDERRVRFLCATRFGVYVLFYVYYFVFYFIFILIYFILFYIILYYFICLSFFCFISFYLTHLSP